VGHKLRSSWPTASATPFAMGSVLSQPRVLGATLTVLLAGAGVSWLLRRGFPGRVTLFDVAVVVAAPAVPPGANPTDSSDAADADNRLEMLIRARFKRRAVASAAAGMLLRRDPDVVRLLPLSNVFHVDAMCRHLAVMVYNHYETRAWMIQERGAPEMTAIATGIQADSNLLAALPPVCAISCRIAAQFRNRIVEHPENPHADVWSTNANATPATLTYGYNYNGVSFTLTQMQLMEHLVRAVVFMSLATQALCEPRPAADGSTVLVMFNPRPNLPTALDFDNLFNDSWNRVWAELQHALQPANAVQVPGGMVSPGKPAERGVVDALRRRWDRLAWLACNSCHYGISGLLPGRNRWFWWWRAAVNWLQGNPIHNTMLDCFTPVVLWSLISSVEAIVRQHTRVTPFPVLLALHQLQQRELVVLPRQARNAVAHVAALNSTGVLLLGMWEHLDVPIPTRRRAVITPPHGPLRVVSTFRIDLKSNLADGGHGMHPDILQAVATEQFHHPATAVEELKSVADARIDYHSGRL